MLQPPSHHPVPPPASAPYSALGASPPRTAGVSCNEPIVVVRALPGSTARPNNTAGTLGSEGLPAVPGRAMAGEVRGESEKKPEPSPRDRRSSDTLNSHPDRCKEWRRETPVAVPNKPSNVARPAARALPYS